MTTSGTLQKSIISKSYITYRLADDIIEDQKVLYIEHIEVDPSERGQGIAHKLMEIVEKKAKSMKIQAASYTSLHTNSDEEYSTMKHLYDVRGWVEAEEDTFIF